MTTHRWIWIVTAMACAPSCAALEMMRINGWYNRFTPMGWEASLFEVATTGWASAMVVVYLLIFAPLLVVTFSRCAPRLRLAWCLYSVAMLVINCAYFPGAYEGRHMSTSDGFVLFYVLAVPIPALACLVIGPNVQTKHQQGVPSYQLICTSFSAAAVSFASYCGNPSRYLKK